MENNNQNQGDTYSYKGWMNSDKFLKRAFGTWGHVMVAQLIVVIPIYVIMIVVAVLIGSAMSQ